MILGGRGMMQPATNGPPAKSPISQSQLLVVEAGIREAWRRIAKKLSPSASEVEVNTSLEAQLNELLAKPTEVAGFDYETFETVVRGGEQTDASGGALEKRPDLAFRLARSHGGSKSNWALFVECKIVDKTHRVSRYCKDGLARFVDGRYAWAVNVGMMVAYTRDGFTLPKKLQGHLRRTAECHVPKLVLTKCAAPSQAYESTHPRSHIKVPPPAAATPPDIRVVHLWLTETD